MEPRRRLRITGILLIAPAFLVLGYFSELTDWLPLAESLRSGQLPRRGLLFVAAGNALALGVFVLLAGFTDRPFLSGPGGRRSLLLRMAGANVLIVFSGVILLHDQGVLGIESETGAAVLIGFIFLGLLARGGVLMVRRGWKYHALDAQTLMQRDDRPPVVYIRSFAADDSILQGSRLVRLLSSAFAYMTAISVEQELALILRRIGPVVAIGRPGEALPELGAARLYASDEEWRDVITGLMRRASLVVVRAGATPNLQWEIDQATTLLPLRKLVLVCLGRRRELQRFEADLARRFGAEPVPDDTPESPLLRLARLVLRAGTGPVGTVVYFDDQSVPHAVRLRFGISLSAFSLGTRPYHGLLTSGFRLVFHRLGYPWVGRRSRTVAVLLAVFAGGFGAHHFYVGDRRRGLLYLAFFWTVVPFFLAWRDAVRLMLIEQPDLERRFLRPGRSA